MGTCRGEGFKGGEYVCISTVDFPFLKIFSIRKKEKGKVR